jgi:hypothetical protein
VAALSIKVQIASAIAPNMKVRINPSRLSQYSLDPERFGSKTTLRITWATAKSSSPQATAGRSRG